MPPAVGMTVDGVLGMTIDTHEFLEDAAVLDFTSALYLGFWHATPAFPPWPRLTTGAPAALADPPGADHVAARLARLQGCETAVLGTSTLHVFWDVLGWLGRDGTAIYVDAGAYPIAALSGSAEMVEQFKAASQTRVHCSPPSVAHIHAARHALDLNDQVGDTARQRLVERVTLFRQRLADRGLRSTGGLFPVQSLPSLPTATAQAVHQGLLAAGVQALLRGGNAHDAHLTWVLTARHRREAIAQAVTALAATLEPLVAPPEEPG